jgi:hypothetical protein
MSTQTRHSLTSEDKGRNGSKPLSPTATHDHFDRLPTELQCIVASYTAGLADRKALSLVNMAWYKLMLPILWRTLTTDLIKRDGRRFSDLGPSMNIVKHIHNINLLHRTIAGNVDYLQMLLQIIPLGQLQSFESTDPMQLSTLQALLWAHRKLVKLQVPSTSALCTILQSTYTLGCFRELKSLTVDVTKFSCDGLRRLWNECSKLTHISFVGGSITAIIPEDAFMPWSDTKLKLSTSISDSRSLVYILHSL